MFPGCWNARGEACCSADRGLNLPRGSDFTRFLVHVHTPHHRGRSRQHPRMLRHRLSPGRVRSGAVEAASPVSKEKVRGAIRLLPGGESKWTRPQALFYGRRRADATPFEGMATFFRHCAQSGTRAWIVSHKTPLALLDGEQVDIRQPALRWVKANGFFEPDGLALSRHAVFVETTRAEKLERIRALGCTHFIDDLAEVFAEEAFPRETVKLLFAPHGAKAPPDVRAFRTWGELQHSSPFPWCLVRYPIVERDRSVFPLRPRNNRHVPVNSNRPGHLSGVCPLP